MTILLASHDPAVAARTDRLLRMRDGTLIDDIGLAGQKFADSSRVTGLLRVPKRRPRQRD